jgi:hypothetical protein
VVLFFYSYTIIIIIIVGIAVSVIPRADVSRVENALNPA